MNYRADIAPLNLRERERERERELGGGGETYSDATMKMLTYVLSVNRKIINRFWDCLYSM